MITKNAKESIPIDKLGGENKFIGNFNEFGKFIEFSHSLLDNDYYEKKIGIRSKERMRNNFLKYVQTFIDKEYEVYEIKMLEKMQKKKKSITKKFLNKFKKELKALS